MPLDDHLAQAARRRLLAWLLHGLMHRPPRLQKVHRLPLLFADSSSLAATALFPLTSRCNSRCDISATWLRFADGGVAACVEGSQPSPPWLRFYKHHAFGTHRDSADIAIDLIGLPRLLISGSSSVQPLWLRSHRPCSDLRALPVLPPL
jgi:hypothetical protein